jgi:hypothetical protein
MADLILNALNDTAVTIPLPGAAYLLAGLFEFRHANRFERVLRHGRLLGPLVGAAVGCAPQSGFPVIGSAYVCPLEPRAG